MLLKCAGVETLPKSGAVSHRGTIGIRTMTSPRDVDERMAAFKKDLTSLTSAALIEKHILLGQPYALAHEQYRDLKMAIAGKYNIDSRDIIMVGSGKLGFSIAPNKRYRPFCDTSDIDLAIISNDLFDRIWEGSVSLIADGFWWPKMDQFRNYMFNGWMRPDMMPSQSALPDLDDWWEYFRSLTSSGVFGPYRIAAGLYRTRFFFDAYQQRAVARCVGDADAN